MRRNDVDVQSYRYHYPLARRVLWLVDRFLWYRGHPRSVVCHTFREPLQGWPDRCLLPTLWLLPLQRLPPSHQQDNQQALEINHPTGQASQRHIPLTRPVYQVTSRLNRITQISITIITANIVNTRYITARMVQAPPQKLPPAA